jgi:hypothetical protein
MPRTPRKLGKRLSAASAILGVPEVDLVSIKLRPVWAGETEPLWRSDYPTINKALEHSSLKFVKTFGFEDRYKGKTTLYEVSNGIRFLYVEHESGPEIILHTISVDATAVAAVLVAANQFLTLVNRICRRFNKAPSRDGVFHKTSDVSIEARTLKWTKVLKEVSETAADAGKAIEKVEELFPDHT